MQTSVLDSVPTLRNILVATDFSGASEAAFQTAIGLGKVLHAHLSILHVFKYSDTIPPDLSGERIELQRPYTEAKSLLDDLVRVARQAGLTCQATMGGGIPSSTILEAISTREIDLALLGTNALHGFERLVFGSTAEAILRKAPCPVMTVGPQAAQAAKADWHENPVVFATDFHLTTTHAIRYAASFCKLTGSRLHCLHVLPHTIEGGFRSHIIPQVMTEALRHVAEESGVVIDPPVCAIAYGSDIPDAIVSYAQQQKAKLIVLGVQQASAVASHVPAHIAYQIITEASCPVLTMDFA